HREDAAPADALHRPVRREAALLEAFGVAVIDVAEVGAESPAINSDVADADRGDAWEVESERDVPRLPDFIGRLKTEAVHPLRAFVGRAEIPAIIQQVKHTDLKTAAPGRQTVRAGRIAV